jgi:hypothetical protein
VISTGDLVGKSVGVVSGGTVVVSMIVVSGVIGYVQSTFGCVEAGVGVGGNVIVSVVGGGVGGIVVGVSVSGLWGVGVVDVFGPLGTIDVIGITVGIWLSSVVIVASKHVV